MGDPIPVPLLQLFALQEIVIRVSTAEKEICWSNVIVILYQYYTLLYEPHKGCDA